MCMGLARTLQRSYKDLADLQGKWSFSCRFLAECSLAAILSCHMQEKWSFSCCPSKILPRILQELARQFFLGVYIVFGNYMTVSDTVSVLNWPVILAQYLKNVHPVPKEPVSPVFSNKTELYVSKTVHTVYACFFPPYTFKVVKQQKW